MTRSEKIKLSYFQLSSAETTLKQKVELCGPVGEILHVYLSYFGKTLTQVHEQKNKMSKAAKHQLEATNDNMEGQQTNSDSKADCQSHSEMLCVNAAGRCCPSLHFSPFLSLSAFWI